MFCLASVSVMASPEDHGLRPGDSQKESPAPKPMVDPSIEKGGDLAINLMPLGIKLYDYYEKRSEDKVEWISVTFMVPRGLLSNYYELEGDLIEEIVFRYSNVDRVRGVQFYMVSILADPDVVIQFEISRQDIESLIEMRDIFQKKTKSLEI